MMSAVVVMAYEGMHEYWGAYTKGKLV
jgi:hypothetical protein